MERPLSDTYDLNPEMVGAEAAEMNQRIRDLAKEIGEDGQLSVKNKLMEYSAEFLRRAIACLRW